MPGLAPGIFNLCFSHYFRWGTVFVLLPGRKPLGHLNRTSVPLYRRNLQKTGKGLAETALEDPRVRLKF